MADSGRGTPAYRHRLLRRTRAISLGITAGAAVASLGLGTAFAHAIPGHSRPPAAQLPRSSPAGHRQAAAAPQPGRAGRPASSTRPHHGHRRHRVTPPSQPPASTPAPPQVSSGGS